MVNVTAYTKSHKREIVLRYCVHIREVASGPGDHMYGTTVHIGRRDFYFFIDPTVSHTSVKTSSSDSTRKIM